MPCYHPLIGYEAKEANESGKHSIVFNHRDGYYDRMVKLPCGQCIGCRLERSRQWAVRCVHEASLYDENCFITLTFNDANINLKGSLVKRDFQLFMKRLRKMFSPRKIRFFHCGEYGELLKRPHHHACLFNFDFPDKVLWSENNGVKLYRSEILEKLWPYGYCTVGEVNFESAAYVARYVLKKVTGKKADEHYKGRVPEYVTMSRRPGIGDGWIAKFSDDVYPLDFIVVRGVKCKPPKYYDYKYDLTNHESMSIIEGNRERKAKHDPNSRSDRLMVREEVKKSRINLLKRSYENETESV